MIKKRFSKSRLGRFIFGCLFAIISIFSLAALPAKNAYADPEPTEETTVVSCEDSLGEVAWLVCSSTDKIANAVDWLYEKIEDILVIKPVKMEDGEPIYEIWKYARSMTNIVFIILLLVVVYSQITGVGITNYGIKKILPKLIIVAILVNLSFIICSLAVDVSNIVGSGLRGLLMSVEQSAITATQVSESEYYMTMSEIYAGAAEGAALTIGGVVVAFELGAIWMLIPVVLGAIVAVTTGLITIAMRQAVVILLIMIAPLAIVAYMLPNTEKWFKKWKDLFMRMLVFYPMFSLLFGASSLAGGAIIASSGADGFGLILGMAVKIFPLFFSWSLMKMSGTFLATVNAKLNSLAAVPLATTRAWASSRRELTNQKMLASNNPYTPSLRLRQYLFNRKVAREEETKEYAETAKNRGLAYAVMRNYKKDGTPSREGEEAYEMQARNMYYQRAILRHKNNMNKGLGQLEVVKLRSSAAQKARLEALDVANMNEADYLKIEQARGEKIDYNNAMGFHKRMEDAINAHFDEQNEGRRDYRRHDIADRVAAMERYGITKDIMEGDILNVQYAAASAAHGYDTQAKIIMTKFQKYFELTPPTRDVRYRLEEFSRIMDKNPNVKAVDNIDAIISGLRILNQRGDTDFLKDIMDDILDEKYGGLVLGTHASQSLASFLMFDVKDNDPYLRRFGKYINLETARMYDKNKRQKQTVDYDEYILGYHIEPNGDIMWAKKDIVKLMEGTSLDGVERTAFDNYDKSLRKAYTKNGVLDLEAYRKRREEIDFATAPQFISANMKYLSGSEQITSAVKSKSGFMSKQDPKTGEYYMVPVWEDEEEAAQLFAEYANDPAGREKAKWALETRYRNETLDYLRFQTPAQILGLRSDWQVPLYEHLSKAYMFTKEGKVIPERQAEHDRAVQLIADTYGSLDSDDARAALKQLKKDEAGEAFRELLHKKGKLEQISKSKRSGAANNAKDWVRELLLLDTKTGLDTWINKHTPGVVGGGPQGGGNSGGPQGGGNSDGPQGGGVLGGQESAAQQQQQEAIEQQRQQEQSLLEQRREMERAQQRQMLEELAQQLRAEADPVLSAGQLEVTAYSAEDVAMHTHEIERLYYDNKDTENEYDEFYRAASEYVGKNLGSDSFVALAFKKYYKDNPSGDSYDMREYLTELLKSLVGDS